MRLLIYGAGVIGCLYAALFSKAGYCTTIYARGKRLELLQRSGLTYVMKGKIHNANITVIEKLENHDYYDFIFVTVKENQVHTALKELSNNISPNIVTMVNTLETYSGWEELCGKGRIIPAFPGAGGSFENEVLKAALTPWIIQPTTFAEIDGSRSERLISLAGILRKSKIPYQIVDNMQQWQLCHLAMVVPIADAYYKAKNPEKVWEESKIMVETSKQMKINFEALYKRGVKLSPRKMNIFRLFPTCILTIGLTLVFRSSFGNMFMYQHSMNAPDEMRQLHNQFYQYINSNS